MARTGRPRKAEQITRECDWCGIPYTRPVWEKGRERFHTAACYRAWQAANKKPQPAPKTARVCAFVDPDGTPCQKPYKARGYCGMHLKRLRTHGDPSIVGKGGPRPSTEPHPICSIDGCDKDTVGNGLCRNHYMKVYRRGGDPAVTLPRGNFSTPISSRTHMFVQGDPDECWEWQGSTNKNGYGITGLSGKNVLAHRAVYLEMVGPIPEGMQLDHLCANRICVNPNHLEPVTSHENQVRGGEPHFFARGKTAKVTWEDDPEPVQVTIGPKVRV